MGKGMIALGFEGSINKIGVGIVTLDGTILSNPRHTYITPLAHGFLPRETAHHHLHHFLPLICSTLETASNSPAVIDCLCYTKGPDMGVPLQVAAVVVGILSQLWRKPIIVINHCVAHIEMGSPAPSTLSQSAGFPYLHAYLDSIAPNFKHGVNFATAGATITTTNTTLSQSWVSPISLNVQILEYYQFRTRSQLPTNPEVFKSLLPKKEYFYQGLYTFDIGQNDLVAAYFSGMTTDEVIAAVPDIVNHFGQIVKDIYWQGGRSFWIHNTGPIGCLPYLLERYPVGTIELDRYGCGRTFNLGAQYFNEKLKEVVVQLRKDLPLAALTYVDIYSVKYNLITHAKTYGFENPFVACCGQLGMYYINGSLSCGATKHINGKKVLIGKSCKNPSVRVSWDGIHFTEAANKWIFNQIADGAFSDPPLPLRLACHRQA